MARTLTARIAATAALAAAAFAIAAGSAQPAADHTAAAVEQVRVVSVGQDLPADGNPWD
jgi:hypothetical protein